jgi:hypothetical protein
MVSLHERAKDLFLAALDRPPDDRRRFIAEACGTDLALFAEVESLLKFHEETGGAQSAATPRGQTPAGGRAAATRPMATPSTRATSSPAATAWSPVSAGAVWATSGAPTTSCSKPRLP